MSFGRTPGQTWTKHMLRGQCQFQLMGRFEHFIYLWVSPCSSLTEMEKWMDDIKMAIDMGKTSNGPSSDLLTSNLTDNSKLLHKLNVEYDMYTFSCHRK